MESVDKTRLFETARRIGVPVAPGGVAASGEEAKAIARELGFPVVVRFMIGSGGDTSARCATADEVAHAVQRLRPAMGNRETGPGRFLVQRWIDGPVVTRASLAWNGREIAGATRGRLETHPAPFGPASVVEYAGLPAVAQSSDTLCAALGLHGLIGLQFIIDPADGSACLVEINRRMLPATHGAAHAGIDLAAALFAMATGGEWTGPRDLPDGPGPRLALFPQEWHRDPASRWLHTVPTDAPWHDPGLFVAMLKARLS
jgi:biotin carboxylase